MKSQPHRNTAAHHDAGRSEMEARSARERAAHAICLRGPPIVPYRRYPSLSDSGQPYFPRFWRTRRRAEETPSETGLTVVSDRVPFVSVRAMAALAFIILIVVLLATA